MGEIKTILMDLEDGVRGDVNYNSDGSYTIFINAKLSIEMQREAFVHEVGHIINKDFDKENVDIVEFMSHTVC